MSRWHRKNNELLANGYDINAQNMDGHTPLHCAVINGGLEAVAEPLAEGADVKLKNNHGPSAWLLALKNFNITCFIIII